MSNAYEHLGDAAPRPALPIGAPDRAPTEADVDFVANNLDSWARYWRYGGRAECADDLDAAASLVRSLAGPAPEAVPPERKQVDGRHWWVPGDEKRWADVVDHCRKWDADFAATLDKVTEAITAYRRADPVRAATTGSPEGNVRNRLRDALFTSDCEDDGLALKAAEHCEKCQGCIIDAILGEFPALRSSAPAPATEPSPEVERAVAYLRDFIAYEPGTTMRPQREKAESCVKYLVAALRSSAPAPGGATEDAERLRRALRSVQHEVTHKRGGVEDPRSVSIEYLKKVVDAALAADRTREGPDA